MSEDSSLVKLKKFKKSWTAKYEAECKEIAEKYGLSGLRALSKEELLKLFPPRKRTDVFGDKKFIITSVLAMKLIEHEYSSMIRGLMWYGIFKATVHKVYGEEAATDKDFADKKNNLIYAYLSSLVQLRVISYKELNIALSGLQQSECFHDYRNVIVFVEDDDTFHKIADLCEIFGVKLISGGGSASTSNIEEFLSSCDIGEEYTLLILTDFDRYGTVEIMETFIARCKIMGMKIKEARRIGINRDQVSEAEFLEHRYRIPVAKKLAKKDKKTGEIYYIDSKDRIKDLVWIEKNGEFGIELQALGQANVNKLRSIVAENLNQFCDEQLKYDDLRETSFANAPIMAIDNVRETLLRKLNPVLDKAADEVFSTIEDDREDFPKGTLMKKAIAGNHLFMSSRTFREQIEEQIFEKIISGEIDVPKLIKEAIGEGNV